MREIKFRAWHKDLKKMFKVGQITFEKGTWNYEPENKEYIGISVPAQPSFELMQYTGLKDKNGKEIYEGDLVKHEYNEKPYKVYFKEDRCGYSPFANDGGCGCCCDTDFTDIEGIEVIGNIYDNPELFEEE